MWHRIESCHTGSLTLGHKGRLPQNRPFCDRRSCPAEGSTQGSVKVAVCTQCPSVPAAGTYLPTWINAAMWRWLVMWASDE